MNLVTLKNWLDGKGKRRVPITTIVLHATAGSTASGALSTLRLRGLSYHAIIEDQRETDGKVIKAVPDTMTAAHAGKSVGPDGPGVNAYSLGLSFVNLNDGQDPYSEAQINAALDRCESWCLAYPTIRWITTHWAISPGRKTDPKGFPHMAFVAKLNNRLAKHGRFVEFWQG